MSDVHHLTVGADLNVAEQSELQLPQPSTEKRQVSYTASLPQGSLMR
jgi:hypothetical protein